MIAWQEKATGEAVWDEIVVLWTGEVLFVDEPGGMSSPFFLSEEEARAWGIEAGRGLPEEDVCAVQVVKWHCAARFAGELLGKGDEDYKRLARFWVSPIRVQAVLLVSPGE